MRKSIWRDLLILSIIFFIGWFLFSNINFFKEEKVNQITTEKEIEIGKKMSENILEDEANFKLVDNAYMDSAINEIMHRFDSNALDESPYNYHIYVFENALINAFALPGGYIFISTGLIHILDSSEELAAILGHEIGHVEDKHVLSRLLKEFTLKILMEGDSFVLSEVSKSIAGLSFDRHQEKNADEFAQDILKASEIDPRVLAKVFRKMKENLGDVSEAMEIVSSHPNLTSRIRTALEYDLDDEFKERKLSTDWNKLKEEIESDSE